MPYANQTFQPQLASPGTLESPSLPLFAERRETNYNFLTERKCTHVMRMKKQYRVFHPKHVYVVLWRVVRTYIGALQWHVPCKFSIVLGWSEIVTILCAVC